MRFLHAGTIFLLAAILGTHAYRLPSNIVPQHYTLKILTNLGDENGTFDFCGNVTIQVIKFFPKITF